MISRGLYGGRGVRLEIREQEVRAPASDEVLVGVRCCGVCGTDLNFVRDWSDGLVPLGHEIAGEILEVGAGVRNLRSGDRVTVEDCTMCGNCLDCKSGHPERCRNMHTLQGQPGMGEYLTVKAASVNRFEGLDFAAAALTEPLAVALAAVRTSQVALGDRVVVLGAGAIGLLIAALCRIAGASDLTLVASNRDTRANQVKLETARKIGVSTILRTGIHDVTAAYLGRNPTGAEQVFVTSPPKTLPVALSVARFGGTVNLLGLDFGGGASVPLDVNELVFHKQRLLTTFAEPAIGFSQATALIQSGAIHPECFLGEPFGFETAEQRLKEALAGELACVKTYFMPG